jgi:hypothetical protein
VARQPGEQLERVVACGRGFLHALNALAILGITGWMAHASWRPHSRAPAASG